MAQMTQMVSLVSLFAVSPVALGQAIVNGSLTGPAGPGLLPAGWSSFSGSPDTADASGPFNFTGNPWAASPDGGTFVRMGRGPANMEGIVQTVSGFTAGQTYSVDFFATNLGFLDPTGAWLGTDGFVDFFVDGSLAGTSSVTSKPASPGDSIVWSGESLSFVATASTMDLAFAGNWVAPGNEAAYIGIDGIRVKLVPAPGAMGVLGGLALVGRRRRG